MGPAPPSPGGARWSKVFRRRQQFYGEVYYHTKHDEPAVQPHTSITAVGIASSANSPSAPDIASEPSQRAAPAAHKLEDLSFVIDKFYHEFWRGAAARAEASQGSGGFVFGEDRKHFPTQILVNEYVENFGISSHFEDCDAFGSVIGTVSLVSPIFMSESLKTR